MQGLHTEAKFTLIEEIKNLAQRLSVKHEFVLYWIPSHIEVTSAGKRPITGNVEADRLANLGRERSTPLDTQNKIDKIRDQILHHSAVLVSEIGRLLEQNPHEQDPTDGPSDSDDISTSNAIRNLSREVP